MDAGEAAMWPSDVHALVKREQYQDYLRVQAEDRRARVLLRAAGSPRPAGSGRGRRLTSRLAAPLGRALRWLGMYCVRVGTALELYGASGRS